MINIESIYAALFTKLQAAPGFVTTSRRLKHWDDTTAAEQPALFQSQRDMTIEQVKGIPPKYTLNSDVYVYVMEKNKNATPSTKLNMLINAVLDALKPDFTNVQNLGLENVSHCWVEGRIETDEGTLGDQAVAIIPVKILATD